MIVALIALGSFGCAKNKQKIIREESGMFSQHIKIRSLPTKADIYINDVKIGTTPLKYKVRHEDARLINIKAVPLYPNQYTQNIFVMVPPIPKTMTIYMNHFPPDYERNKAAEFSPPKKPDPQVIVQTEIDTVYIEKQITQTRLLNLPAIYFDTDQSDLKSSEIPKLQALAETLKENDSFYLDIYGFADERASESHNIKLTLNRATAVKNYLIELGVNEKRLTAYGHGKVSQVSSDGLQMELSESRKVLFLIKHIP
ncbi:MAG: OmpA family protein [Candidatus Cloacimonetes bacterium]|jgi:outer membrane protein OmpA-like peptidoglycan-associated protein|nr:OmpA family protein [Candidatus Cloacimonadota bacterium]